MKSVVGATASIDPQAHRANHAFCMSSREPVLFWEMLDAAERHPRVTAWERRFLAAIRHQIDVDEQPWLSDDRSRVLAGIAIKAGVPLPDAVRDLMADRAGLLVAFAVGALGDPRLTAWEEAFLSTLLETGMICRPSDKQIVVLEQIAAKVDGAPAVGEAAD